MAILTTWLTCLDCYNKLLTPKMQQQRPNFKVALKHYNFFVFWPPFWAENITNFKSSFWNYSYGKVSQQSGKDMWRYTLKKIRKHKCLYFLTLYKKMAKINSLHTFARNARSRCRRGMPCSSMVVNAWFTQRQSFSARHSRYVTSLEQIDGTFLLMDNPRSPTEQTCDKLMAYR